MLKYFILIILISASLQIDNCEITEKVCKTCQEGHSLVEYYYGVRCIETTKLKEHQKIDINCIESSGGKCTYCKRDYVLSKKKINVYISHIVLVLMLMMNANIVLLHLNHLMEHV